MILIVTVLYKCLLNGQIWRKTLGLNLGLKQIITVHVFTLNVVHSYSSSFLQYTMISFFHFVLQL